MTPTLTDTRRITEHDPAFLTLHAATVAKLRHSLDTYAQELQHATTIPSPNAFITRHTAILTGAYVTGHAEGARPFLDHYSASQGHPDTDRMHLTLSFYVPSVAKMAAEGLAAWQQEQQAKKFADPIPLDDEDYYPPFILDWAQGEPMGARLILQGNILWPAMQNGYLEAGAQLRTKLYWDLDPMARVHCADCPAIAAASPYDPPGSGGNELNQTPGDGHTECGAGCRCALRYADGGDASTLSEGMIFYRPDQLRVKGRFAYEGGRRRDQGRHVSSIRQPGHHGTGASGGGVHISATADAMETAHNIFGRAVSHEEFAHMAGARAGESLDIREANIAAVQLLLHGAGVHGDMEIQYHLDGAIVANVHLLYGDRSAGMGARIIASMYAMRAAGVDRIETVAGGEGLGHAGSHHLQSNGYKIWARLGFKGYIEDDATLHAIRQRFGAGITRVEQMQETGPRRQWWNEHGTSFRATFDFHDPASNARLDRLYAMLQTHEGGQP